MTPRRRHLQLCNDAGLGVKGGWTLLGVTLGDRLGVRLDTSDDLVRMPTDDFLAAWEQARDDADERVALSKCEGEDIGGPFLEGDYWLVTTNDGNTWLFEDLDEDRVEPYPQQAAINGNVVVARIGENWSRYTIS